MPVQYEGIRQEHVNVRTGAGMFDVSHMGEIETSGPQARGRSCSGSSRTTSRRSPSAAPSTRCSCREDGGVLDDLFTYRLGPERFLTVTNAANHEKDLAWFERHADDFDVEVRDAHSDWAMLAVQGPRARAALERLADGELPARMRTAELRLAGAAALVCGTGYTGEDGCELMLAPGDAGRRLGRAARRGRRARRPRRARHAAPRGLLPPVRQRPRRGARPDRGGARLVLQARHRLHRRARRSPAARRSGRSSRSPSRAPASRARATRSAPKPARASSRAARSRPASRRASGWATCPSRRPSRGRRLRSTCAASCAQPR